MFEKMHKILSPNLLLIFLDCFLASLLLRELVIAWLWANLTIMPVEHESPLFLQYLRSIFICMDFVLARSSIILIFTWSFYQNII